MSVKERLQILSKRRIPISKGFQPCGPFLGRKIQGLVQIRTDRAPSLGANGGHPTSLKRFRQCSPSESHQKLSQRLGQISGRLKNRRQPRNFVALLRASYPRRRGPVHVFSRGLRYLYVSLALFALPASAQLKTELVNGYEVVANEVLVKASGGAN